MSTLGFGMILSARAQVIVEERALEARHGAGYRSYRSRVPRWLGLVGRGES